MPPPIDKIALIYIKEGKILSTRSKGKSKYYIPGGKREPGETDQEALVREIKEELSVDCIPESITYIGQFSAQADSHPEGQLVIMTCYQADFTGSLSPDHEIAEIVWLGFDDIEKVSPVDKLIFQALKQAGKLR